MNEYVRTLTDLVGSDGMRTVQLSVDSLPVDELEDEGAFARQDQRLSDRHIESFYEIADGLATYVRQTASARRDLLGACAEQTLDEACLRSGLPVLLTRTLRRPPNDSEVDEVVTTALTFNGDERVHAVMFLALMHPEFLYRFENHGTPMGDTTLQLTAHELAARLSFHFWGTAPDAALRAAADSGALLTEEGYGAQVNRLFEDPRTEATLMEFFAEWLHFDRGGFADSPRLDVLREGIEVNGLTGAMRQELEALLRYHLEAEDGTWSDILTSNLSFAQDARLAQLYGVDAWDGTSPPPAFPTDERSGLLTRAGMLYTADGSTNPFRRGAFVRRAMLCDDLPPPPDNLPPDALQPPPVSEAVTTREAFAAKVTGPPCSTCHVNFSDFGYALEQYDGLGRYRTEERLVTVDGQDLGSIAIDSVAVPQVVAGDTRPINSAVELNQRMVDSGKTDQCLARRYFRFAYRRYETAADNCTVGALAAQLEAGVSLKTALKEVAMQPAFRQREI